MGYSNYARLFKAILTVSLFLAGLTACKFEGGVFGLTSETENDFLKSRILAQNGIADDSTILAVTLEFINSDGTKVSGFTPTFSAEFTGLTSLGCSVSNASGVSVCQFKSSEYGTVPFGITNIGFKLEKGLIFEQVARPSVVEVIAGGNQKQTGSGGWTASSSIGLPYSESLQTGSGYQVFVGAQGSLASP